VRDKLWFFGGYTRQIADSYVAFYEDVDPNAAVYAPSDNQAFDDQSVSRTIGPPILGLILQSSFS
jgi:hypothetical protein